MGFGTALLMAFGLSMDAFAVSITDGARTTRLHWTHALWIGLTFAAFQAAMPLVGWAVGQQFAVLIQAIDHWIAFVLLSVIGARMIYADLRPAPDDGADPVRGWRTLIVLAVATSIDALVVGFSLTFVTSILAVAALIGLVTFGMCVAGVRLGHRYRSLVGGKVQAIGGLILIAIGTRILVEHLGLIA